MKNKSSLINQENINDNEDKVLKKKKSVRIMENIKIVEDSEEDLEEIYFQNNFDSTNKENIL
jgi:hypothetical protein